MDPYSRVDPPLAGLREANSRFAASQSGGDGTAASFLTKIKQILGEKAEPDAAFFIDSWTIGIDAALENYLRRHQARGSREDEMAGYNNSFSFTPFFVVREEASGGAAWQLRNEVTNQGFMAGQRWDGDEQEDGRQPLGPIERVRPLTLESACCVLGVTATSTREQIRTAYRRMASRYHPDRLGRSAVCQQRVASDRMASVNEAYRLLCAAAAGRRSCS
jgi:DnaJ-domain-containing protein 1